MQKVAWYIKYSLSAPGLTREEQMLLDLFTEDEWCALIPYDVLINSKKLTVKDTVRMFENYVMTGRWS